MRISRISIRRLPGIEKPFEIDRMEPGLNIILGPNGSGKTSLCRVIRQTLWPEADTKKTRVLISWDDDESKLVSELDGKAAWQREGESSPAPNLPDSHLRDCYNLQLRDLMEEEGRGDKGLAEEVRDLMAGGYKLTRIDDIFNIKKSHGKKEERELRTARAALFCIETESKKLGEEEAALLPLRQSLQEADRANSELVILNDAVNLARKKKELKQIKSELALFPEGMGLLRGDESERIERLTGEIEEIKKIIDDYRRQIKEAEDEMENNLLPQGPVDATWLSIQEERVRTLETRGNQLESSKRSLEETEGRLGAARQALGSRADNGPAADINEEVLNEVNKWARRAIGLKNHRQELEASLSALPSPEDGGEENIDRLRRAIDLLREWLSSPGPEDGKGLKRVAGLVLVATGAALAYFISPWFVVLAGLGLGVLIVTGISSGRGDRGLFRERFEALGYQGPPGWKRVKVREVLERLESELRHSERLAVAEKERERLQKRLEGLSRDEEGVEEERARLCREHGIDPGAAEPAITDLIGRLKDFRDASLDLAKAKKVMESDRKACRKLMDQISDLLGEKLGERPDDGIGARNLTAALRDKSARLIAAIGRKTSAEREIEAREKEIRKKSESISSIFEGAGFDPSDPDAAGRKLSGNLSRYENYKGKSARAGELENDLDELRSKLAERPNLPDLKVEEAERLAADAREKGKRVAELAGLIQQVEDRIAVAEKSDELDKAMARVKAVEIELAEKYDESRQALAGKLLLEAILSEYEEESRPAVFEQASRWFSNFTGHRYSLVISTGDDPACFRAIDTDTEQGLGLGELSDGTRVQLLLAARLAFATHSEEGKKLPIFLDEALTTSDPARFRAITRSLMVLAGEGRQIFYLTANPSDAEFMKKICGEEGGSEPSLIDLGRIREISAGSRRDELSLPEIETIPAPGKMTPEEYGEELKVPLFDPAEPAAACHLFYLLYNDLKLLYTIMKNTGVGTVGQWRSFLRGNPEPPGLAPEETARVNDLAAILELFISEYEVGRGKPIDREVLEASGEVSSRYIAPFTEMLRELGGDGRKFMELLETGDDPRTARFPNRKKQALRAYLEGNEFIDSRDRLTIEEIRAALTARSEILSRISPEDIMYRISGLWARVNRKGGEDE